MHCLLATGKVNRSEFMNVHDYENILLSLTENSCQMTTNEVQSCKITKPCDVSIC